MGVVFGIPPIWTQIKYEFKLFTNNKFTSTTQVNKNLYIYIYGITYLFVCARGVEVTERNETKT